MKNVITTLLISLVTLSACSKPDLPDGPGEKRQFQTCDTCGAKFSAFSSEKLPPTIDWCINCGSFCETGLSLFVELQELDNPKIKDTFPLTEHYDSCIGCRAAIYPDKKTWEEARDVWQAFEEPSYIVQLHWTVERTYGGSWIVRDENGTEVAGGMSEKDARCNAAEIAPSSNLIIKTIELDFDKDQ